MALLCNGYRATSMQPGRSLGGTTNFAGQTRNSQATPHTARLIYADPLDANPRGSAGPTALVWPRAAGAMASARGTGSTLTSTANPAAGVTISGSSTSVLTTSPLSIQLIAALSGSSSSVLTSSASIGGASFLSGSSTNTLTSSATISAKAHLAGSSTSVLTSSAYVIGLAFLETTEDTGELTAGSIAAAVWSALAASYDDAGTMGEKMNDAGSAGDPWGTALPGAYAEGTAGALMGKLLTTNKFIALQKDPEES